MVTVLEAHGPRPLRFFSQVTILSAGGLTVVGGRDVMSRGPGRAQRQLLAELAASPSAVHVVPHGAGYTPAQARTRRNAARGLVLRGLARALYLRTPDARGAWRAGLFLVPPTSAEQGDVLPLSVPAWHSSAPCGLLSLSGTLQAAVLEQVTGVRVSRWTANRLAREHRESLHRQG